VNQSPDQRHGCREAAVQTFKSLDHQPKRNHGHRNAGKHLLCFMLRLAGPVLSPDSDLASEKEPKIGKMVLSA
jgi:hypothetical protein